MLMEIVFLMADQLLLVQIQLIVLVAQKQELIYMTLLSLYPQMDMNQQIHTEMELYSKYHIVLVAVILLCGAIEVVEK